MTQLGEAVSRQLRVLKKPIIEDRDIWSILLGIYANRSVAYLRGDQPTIELLHRIRSLLSTERVLSRDPDYRRWWRVNALPDPQADLLVCLVDEGTCLSHFSAMQAFRLTERRPTALYLTIATTAVWREMTHDEEERGVPPRRHHHPPSVRGRQLMATTRRIFPVTTVLRNSSVRVTEIGQTFVDMLESPDRCGGMAHVLDVTKRHGRTYLDPIVAAVDNSGRDMTKVRAGYILQELLNLDHPAIERWIKLAQRGGSRKLDPHAPYAPNFSETWMISLNV